MADTFNPLQLSAPDLLRWIEGREPRAITSWRELGAAEYARSFAAAQTAGYDVIDDLYFAMVDTIEGAGTEVDYANLVVPIMEQKGWLGGDRQAIASRVNLIYVTNLRMARATGKWDRVQKMAPTFPYIRAITARDERVRRPPKSPHSDHTAWDGILLPADHSFWTRWWPPLGFRCRCDTIQMSRSQVLRWAGGVTTADELAQREARLGKPVFAAPAAGITKQIADTVDRGSERMDGIPSTNPQTILQRGGEAWDKANSDASYRRVENVINNLFGKAA